MNEAENPFVADAENPLKWLLYELPAYIEPAPLASLMERYERNKKLYERKIRIRHAERVIKVYERRDSPDALAKLARWRGKLAKLKEEQR